MANLVEAAKGYLGSVAKRTVGISAWQNAMMRPDRFPHRYETNYQWARPINQAFDRGAVIDSLMQTISPVTGRYLIPLLDNPGTSREKLDYILIPGAMIAMFAADAALFTSVAYSTHNPVEFVTVKLAINAATQAGLDLVETAVKKIRSFRPPIATIFTI